MQQQKDYTYEELKDQLKDMKKDVNEFKNEFKHFNEQIKIIKQYFLDQQKGDQNV